jgi:hypothetical protein
MELGITTITRTSHFFELGGDSLSALRVCRRLSERLHALGLVLKKDEDLETDSDYDNDGKPDQTSLPGKQKTGAKSHNKQEMKVSESASILKSSVPTAAAGEFGEALGALTPAELIKRPHLVCFAAYLRKEAGGGGDGDLQVVSACTDAQEEKRMYGHGSAERHVITHGGTEYRGNTESADGNMDTAGRSTNTLRQQDAHSATATEKTSTDKRSTQRNAGKNQDTHACKDVKMLEAHSAEGLYEILLAAAGCGADGVVEFLVIHEKVDADAAYLRDGSVSPLLVACANGHEKAAGLLCKYALSVCLCVCVCMERERESERDGSVSPLLVGCAKGHEKAAGLLCKYALSMCVCVYA